ncbi:MAG TPA: hypothetical protein VIR58_11690 [Acidimicrobiales bacterium]
MAPVPEPPPDLANDDDDESVDGVPTDSPAEGVVSDDIEDPAEPAEPG